LNLNGIWNFKFDKNNKGEEEKWYSSVSSFNEKITGSFSLGLRIIGNIKIVQILHGTPEKLKFRLSGQGKKSFTYCRSKRLDNKLPGWMETDLGSYQGGYTPFEFDLSPYIINAGTRNLYLKLIDTPHPFNLKGSRGYGQAKGIWQTVYLEARGSVALHSVHFTPDIDASALSINGF